jgi:hypothetical protein
LVPGAQDTGLPGWHGLIPFYNLYVLLRPSDGPNPYGENGTYRPMGSISSIDAPFLRDG